MTCPSWHKLTLLVLLSIVFAAPVNAQDAIPTDDASQEAMIQQESSPSEREAVKKEIEQATKAIEPEKKPEQYSGTYTLRAAVMKSLKDNPSIEAARKGATSAEESRKSARGAFGPALSTTYSGSYNDPHVGYLSRNIYQWVVTVSQPIFTGFNLLATYNSAALNAKSQDIALNQAELNLIFLVQQNFINLLSARENVKSSKDSVERLASQLKVAQAFYDVGLKPRIDVLRAEAQLSDAENTLLSDQNTVLTQEARLNTLLNLPVNAPIDYEGELAYFPFDLTLQVSLDIASHLRPDILIARKATEISQEDVTIAASEFYPQVDGTLSVTRNGDTVAVNGFRDATEVANFSTPLSQTQVGINASWSLFSWGTTYYATTSAQQTVLSNKALEANTWQEAAFEIKSRYLNITNSAKRIKVAEKSVAAAEEAYRMAVARYQAQVGTNTDVLDAQSDLSTAEASLISARGDYMIAVASLYNAIGKRVPGLATDKIGSEIDVYDCSGTEKPDMSSPMQEKQ